MKILSFVAALSLLVAMPPLSQAAEPAAQFAVGPQYGTTHVYLRESDVDGFAKSFVATFGGSFTKPMTTTITPTPSSTVFQAVRTPVGVLSVFGFKTPVPYPFGLERTGYLVTDMNAAITAAQHAGASVLVATFPDPIGRDTIVQWPGGINMQFYWHTVPPSAPALLTIPDNRIYLSPDNADAFIRSFLAFSRGIVTSDKTNAPGIEIGKPGQTYRRIAIESTFGNQLLLVTDGQLPYPYGYETTGYGVSDLDDTLKKANAAGVTILVPPVTTDGRQSAMAQFPGGYIAEIHAMTKP